MREVFVMRKLRGICATLVALLLLVGVFATTVEAASPALERITKNGVLRVGVSGNQAPLNMKDRSGKLMGLEIDLAQVMARAFKVRLQLVEKPFPELLSAMKGGEVDIVMSGMSITPERSIDATFVGPYVMSGKSILTKSTLLARAQDTSDVNDANIKLVVLAGSTSEDFVKRNLPRATPVTVSDYDQAIEMVRKEEVDAMVADMPACILAVLRYQGEGLLTLNQPLSIEPIGIAIPAGDPQFENLLDNYLNAIEGAGIMELLRQKWLEDGSWVAALP
jgi:polar amino acid transport system substrate-binding protein